MRIYVKKEFFNHKKSKNYGKLRLLHILGKFIFIHQRNETLFESLETKYMNCLLSLHGLKNEKSFQNESKYIFLFFKKEVFFKIDSMVLVN